MKHNLTIGMPVYNGQKYINEALLSISNQTYSDFKVIICDNASTDNTPKICNEHCIRDSRFEYIRNDINLGAAPNFNKAFKLSSSKYFKWAAYDDILSKNYIKNCISILDKDQSVVLCHSKSLCIDSDGKIVNEYFVPRSYSSSSKSKRFKGAICDPHACIEIFGLIRTCVLNHTGLIGNFVSSDRYLLAELSIKGRFAIYPDFLFFRREHQETSLNTYPDPRKRAGWFNSKKKIQLSPKINLVKNYVSLVNKENICFVEKVMCYLSILKFAYNYKYFIIDEFKQR